MSLIALKVYRKFVTIDILGCKLIYLKLQKALYGLLKLALLFYRKLWGNSYTKGLEIHPYNPCLMCDQQDHQWASNDSSVVRG